MLFLQRTRPWPSYPSPSHNKDQKRCCLLITGWPVSTHYSHNVESEINREKAPLWFLLISVIIIIRFDFCLIEISRDTLSVNADAIGSEPITPTLSTLTQVQSFLKIRCEKFWTVYIAHSNVPNFIKITASKTYQLVCYILVALSTSSIMYRTRKFMNIHDAIVIYCATSKAELFAPVWLLI